MSDKTTEQVAALLAQFRAAEGPGGAPPSYSQRAKRSEILDELQELVGLGGKMVTENDILKRADQPVGK